jgi:hypothetical protein
MEAMTATVVCFFAISPTSSWPRGLFCAAQFQQTNFEHVAHKLGHRLFYLLLQNIFIWYIIGTLLVHCWYIVGTLLVHCWYIVGTWIDPGLGRWGHWDTWTVVPYGKLREIHAVR